jgi:protein-S-isoprenylcysteine O-methyltransferase Ste14
MTAVARVFSQHRIAVSRVFGFGFLAAVLLTGSRWQGSLAADLMFLAGLMLAAAGMVGRIWCLVYSSGYKSSQLVTAGPYVVSRNPLYFFSFVGLIGIGLSTATLMLTTLVVLFFWSVYPAVIDGEEEFLRAKFGAQYAAYCERTPRFFPRWKLFSEPDSYEVRPKTLRQSLGGVLWFIGLPALIHLLMEMREAGLIGWLALLP